jgi:hypothetical protein
MEMDTGSVLLELVVNGNNNGITPASSDSWTRHLPIDGETESVETIRRDGGVGDIESVCHDFAGYGRILIVVCVDIKATECLRVVTGLSFAWCTIG